MAHGPDTPTLMEQISNIQNDTLSVRRLNIISLPELPSTLRILDVLMNKSLTELPKLPASVKELNLIANQKLTAVPKLPPSLELLAVTDTPITANIILPSTFKELSLGCMDMTTLPELPPSLEMLHISDIPITSLPELPASLKRLYLYNTQVTHLPELPVGMDTFDTYNTPLIIPYRKERREIGADGETIVIEAESIASYNARWMEARTRVARAIRAELAARLA